MRNAILLAILIVPSIVRGDDTKSDSLTVLPWTDASLVFTSKDKRANLSYSQTADGGLGVQIQASAPLDQDTRIAAFTDDNQLVSGFKGALQIGWDSRAARIAALGSVTRDVAEAVKTLSKVPDSVRIQNEFVTANHIEASTGAIYQWFCTKQSVSADDCRHEDVVLPKLCSAYLGAVCTDRASFETAATAFWKQHCGSVAELAGDDLTKCTVAGVLDEQLARETVAEQLLDKKRALANAETVKRIIAIYKYLKPDDAKSSGETVAERAQFVANNAGKIADAIEEFVQTAPAERCDALLFAIQDHQDYALLLDVSMSYDRTKVYIDDIAPKAQVALAYDFAIGPDLTVYTSTKGLAANFRAGFERKRAVDAKTFERCVAEPTTDMTITGKQCDSNALFRKGPVPAPSNAGYLRAAVDYQYPGPASKDKLVPGVELRGGLEGIGDKLAVDTRLSLFGTPTNGNTAARVGVASAGAR